MVKKMHNKSLLSLANVTLCLLICWIRATPASSLTWTGPKMGSTSCQIQATMRSFTVSEHPALCF